MKNTKIENIKKLKLEGKYKHIHYEECFSNDSNGIQNLNSNNENHYLTTLKGNIVKKKVNRKMIKNI